MTARAIGFNRADLLDMPFCEMIAVWMPEVSRILEEAP